MYRKWKIWSKKLDLLRDDFSMAAFPKLVGRELICGGWRKVFGM
jgi:hypothetical protein